MAFNVAQFLADQAHSQPEAAAVRAPAGRLGDGSIRYVERGFAALEAEAGGAALWLRERGVRRGTRVLLMVRPGLDLIRIVFALFKIGAVPVVIDPGMGLRGFLRCVRHSAPEALVGIPAAMWVARVFRRSFCRAGIQVPVGGHFTRQVERLAGGDRVPVADSGQDELAAVLFTSGSTGPAKGVCYTHGMFAAQVASIQRHYGIESGEVDLPMLPIFALFNPALGMCTVVPEMNPSRPAAVDPAKIVRAIGQNAVTNSFGSPVLWSRIADYCEHRAISLPSLRRVLMAGAPVPPELMRRMRAILPEGEVHSPYGATEALPVTSISGSEVLSETADRTAGGVGTCVGKPLPGVRLEVVRPVNGPIGSFAAVEPLPMGEIGEIIVSGPTVTRCYDGLPEADATAKIADGTGFWHRMGDLGWLDEAGRLWFCGRKVERVETTDGPRYTDCCEAIFNAHREVFRSALIDLGGGVAGIVIEPKRNAFPRSKQARARFTADLIRLGSAHPMTAGIRDFYFERRFPVDVRHNAKIHRLVLARKWRRATKGQ